MSTQTHIPVKHRKNPELCEQLYGFHWRKPRLLCDIGALDLIYDPPSLLHRSDFRAYQAWMADQIMEHEGVYLAAAMGLGKTGATLWAIVQMLDEGKVNKVLIVAPFNVAENTWPEEIAKWSFARHLEYSVITGDADQRIAALRKEAEVYIINRENLPWLKKHVGTRTWLFDMLVYDEASRLKAANEKTDLERLSEFGVLARMRYKFKKVVLLSGTPAPNGLIDLWGPMYILDSGDRLGLKFGRFKDRWFKYDMYKRTYDPFEHSEREIMGRIEDVFFSLKEEDYLKLPPLMIRDHVCDLPPRAMKLYKEMERHMALEEFDVEAVNSGVLTNKLLQLANGSIYLNDKSEQPVHDAKLDVLDSIVAEASGQPILLGYSYQFDVARIKKRFPFARIYGDSKNDNRDWNAGRIKLMITHPASAGHGLNFQHGGNIAVWYGLTWSLELYQQFLKRLHRSGQKAAVVMMHRILAKNTVDMNVVKTLGKKGVRQDDITDAVRVRLERVQERWKMAA